jgi:hypothetical protein
MIKLRDKDATVKSKKQICRAENSSAGGLMGEEKCLDDVR